MNEIYSKPDKIFPTPAEHRLAANRLSQDKALAQQLASTRSGYVSLDEMYVGDDIDDDFYLFAAEDLDRQQLDSYQKLQTGDRESLSVYDRIGNYYSKQLGRLSVENNRLAEFAAKHSDALSKIDAMAERAISANPSGAQRIREFAEIKKGQYLQGDVDYENLQREIEHLKTIIDAVEAKYYSEDGVMALSVDLPNTIINSPGNILQRSDGKQQTPEVEVAPRSLSMTIGSNAVRIGKTGFRHVMFTNTSHDAQKDYSSERRKALVYMLNNQGRGVSPDEIWNAASDEPFDGAAMRQIRDWFDKLTDRHGKNLICHNGKRGKGSIYNVNPNYSIDYKVEERARKARTKSEKIASADSSVGAEPEQREQSYRVEDIAVAAKHIADFNELTRGYGFEIPAVLISRLSDFLPDYSKDLKELDKPELAESMILKNRADSVGRVAAIIEDPDIFTRVIDEAVVGTPELDFLEWLTDKVRHPKQHELLQKILRGRVEKEALVGRQRQVEAVRRSYYDEFGRPIVLQEEWLRFFANRGEEPKALSLPGLALGPLVEEAVFVHGTDSSSADKELVFYTKEKEAVAPEVIVPDTAAEVTGDIIIPQASDELKKPVEQPKPRREFPWEKSFKIELGNVLDEIWNDGILTIDHAKIPLFLLKNKTRSSKVGTKNSIDRLEKAGHFTSTRANEIVRNFSPLEMTEVVLSYMLNGNKDILGNAKTPAAKQAVVLIEQAISSFLEHKKQEQVNQSL